LSLILISTHSRDDFHDLIDESPAVGFLSKSDLSAAALADVVEDEGGRSITLMPLLPRAHHDELARVSHVT
jgi:hypothetical protein